MLSEIVLFSILQFAPIEVCGPIVELEILAPAPMVTGSIISTFELVIFPICEPNLSNNILFVSSVASIVPVSSQVLISCTRIFSPRSIMMDMASARKNSFLRVILRLNCSSIAAINSSPSLK
jgi:hypothetical protein